MGMPPLIALRAPGALDVLARTMAERLQALIRKFTRIGDLIDRAYVNASHSRISRKVIPTM
jgi:hypothetical protein